MTPPLPFVRLLASVTSVEEARLAAANGADIVDCKDPSRGALGALPLDTVADIRAALPPHIPVSATIGDLAPDPEAVASAVRDMASTGCDIVKIGFFTGGDAPAAVRRLGRERPSATKLVAVMLADQGYDRTLIPAFAAAGFSGVMLDTAAKDGRTLLDHMDETALRTFVAAAQAEGLFAGLAGSLRRDQVADLLRLEPDLLGFRGALCGGDRKSALDPERVARMRAALDGASRPTPPQRAALEPAS